ncbi:MAG: serine/threonine protein kinase [Labilithrix sp.]|nr:serine/threonine protein kinase [Labilithrix sp.]
MGSSSLVGSTLGRFRVDRLLGRGGMGAVYAAFDEKLERDVALKVLIEDGDAALQKKRLLREARLAAKLQHPNIATVYEVDELDGRLYIVMELLEGESLRKTLKQRKVDVEEATAIARDIARALARAHAAGVTHRDIKPENVFLTTPSPDVVLAKVLDFGLARQKPATPAGGAEPSAPSPEHTSTDTSRGDMWGTPGYVSPEQAHGRPVDARTDVFSFGVVFYEMLANIRPFRGDNAIAMMLATTRQEPRPLREILPDLPPEIDEIVRRSLKKNAAERYADGGELSAALDAYVRTSASGRLVHSIGSSPSLPLLTLEELGGQPVPTGPLEEAPTTGEAGIAMMPPRDDAPASSEQRRQDRLKLLVAIGGGLLVALVVIVVGLSLRRVRTEGTAAQAAASSGVAVVEPPSTVVQAPPAPPEPAPALDEPAPERDPEPVAAPEPAPPPVAAPTTTTPPPATSARRKKPADDCSQPFVVDAKGVRIPKIHCLK